MTQARSRAAMLARIEQRPASGDDVATWSARVREPGLTTEAEVRRERLRTAFRRADPAGPARVGTCPHVASVVP